MVAGNEAPRNVQSVDLTEEVGEVLIKEVHSFKVVHLSRYQITSDGKEIRLFFSDKVLDHQHSLVIALLILPKVKIGQLQNPVLILFSQLQMNLSFVVFVPGVVALGSPLRRYCRYRGEAGKFEKSLHFIKITHHL